MSDQERDPSPVGDDEIDDQESEVTNHPDNARASDIGLVGEEPEDGSAD